MQQGVRHTAALQLVVQVGVGVAERQQQPTQELRLTARREDADGSQFVAGTSNGELHLFGLGGGQARSILQPKSPDLDPVRCLALFRDGRRAVTGFESGRLEVRDLERDVVLRVIPAHVRPVSALALSPDESLLADASADGTVRVWDVASGDLKFVLGDRRGAMLDVEFVANDRLVTASRDGVVRWWWLDREKLRKAVEQVPVGPLTQKERKRFPDLLGR